MTENILVKITKPNGNAFYKVCTNVEVEEIDTAKCMKL